ncbi:hypothetical protein ACFWPH_33685 [Nocardia sp. NPDC058499]|uniref:hypothetical protein n=1 Tax=Nocardia sp. NPDC058499 TaxID=3346530 RepID=UPI0036665E0D
MTAPDWPHPDLLLRSRVTGYTGLEAGRGRIRQLHLEVETLARHGLLRRTQLALSGTAGGRTTWTVQAPASTTGEDHAPLASGQ